MVKAEKYKSLKELRELAGLKQSELALLSGITQPYLSEIETDRKPFTKEAAEKISAGFYMILSTTGNPVYIEPEIIRSNHQASRLPLERQQVANELMARIAFYNDYLEHVLSGRGEVDVSLKPEELNIDDNTSYRVYKSRSGANYIAEKIMNSKDDINLHKHWILKMLEEEKRKSKLDYQGRALARLTEAYNLNCKE